MSEHYEVKVKRVTIPLRSLGILLQTSACSYIAANGIPTMGFRDRAPELVHEMVPDPDGGGAVLKPCIAFFYECYEEDAVPLDTPAMRVPERTEPIVIQHLDMYTLGGTSP